MADSAIPGVGHDLLTQLPALERLAALDPVPPPQEFLDAGRELHELRLYYAIESAIPGPHWPASLARNMLQSATRRHRGGSCEGADDGSAKHVQELLDEVSRTGRWLEVRDELAKFTRAARAELARRRPVKKEAPAVTGIVYRGQRAYSVGDRSKSLTLQEHAVLRCFLTCPALDEGTLIDRSGYARAARILAQLRKKYGRIFAPHIDCPGRRGAGGFRARVAEYWVPGRRKTRLRTERHLSTSATFLRGQPEFGP